jgi:hypothetical protein
LQERVPFCKIPKRSGMAVLITSSQSYLAGQTIRLESPNHGTLAEGEGLSTVDLLIKATCFVKEVLDVSMLNPAYLNKSSTWRSTVLSLPLLLVFPAQTLEGRISRYVYIGTVYSIVVLKNASDSDSDCTCLLTKLAWYMG